jgi:hypothetical protein
MWMQETADRLQRCMYFVCGLYPWAICNAIFVCEPHDLMDTRADNGINYLRYSYLSTS